MTQPTPLTDQQLDEIEQRANAATTGPWKIEQDYCDCSEYGCSHPPFAVAFGPFTSFENTTDRHHYDAEFAAHARQDVPALLAEIRRLQTRVAELEEAGTYARSALAALCYDLEDPGSNAFGALYLLQQATLTVDAPKDDTALALARHAREVLYTVADAADPEPPEVSFFGVHGGTVAAWLRMLADRPAVSPAAAGGVNGQDA